MQKAGRRGGKTNSCSHGRKTIELAKKPCSERQLISPVLPITDSDFIGRLRKNLFADHVGNSPTLKVVERVVHLSKGLASELDQLAGWLLVEKSKDGVGNAKVVHDRRPVKHCRAFGSNGYTARVDITFVLTLGQFQLVGKDLGERDSKPLSWSLRTEARSAGWCTSEGLPWSACRPTAPALWGRHVVPYRGRRRWNVLWGGHIERIARNTDLAPQT